MATLSHELPLGAHAERRFEYRVIDTGKHLEEELNTLGARLEGGRRHDKEAAVHRSAAGDHPDARARRSRLRAKQRSSARRTGPADWGMHGRRIRLFADGASRELRDGLGGGLPMSSGARAGVASGSRAASAGRVVSWSLWRPPPASSWRRRRHRPSVLFGSGAVLVAAGAVRGAGDRRPLWHLRCPGEPREAERAHDRAPRLVLPAFLTPARNDAVAYLAGGPGDAATENAVDQGWQSSALNTVSRHPARRPARHRGIERHGGDVTQYGTRMAMDDLDAVRAALGYRQLDVIGSSYGATAAQVYLKLHPSSVRTLILVGGTAIDVPFFDRYAVNAQRALDQLARLCASDPDCRKAFPGWERQFGELVKAWNAHPVNGMTGTSSPPSSTHAARPGEGGLDSARRQPRREGRLHAPRASGPGGSRLPT